ncbi:hypothetical protein ATJ88_2979 [Isoptericola jiangsuensis]|uniref:Uncharacterized protein n=1 Tax=Isoptericola jiangsuensis TaxID=548579 RepID=A0A2A9F1G8_9MICO|nr:hypothetical protein [Isoptericola jiangsuensis]PFG44259.1 hypothetical protein ATJ88_2979 [Isoptericola jiangsuensis]
MPARNVRFVLPVLPLLALTLGGCGPQEPPAPTGDPAVSTVVRQPTGHTLLLSVDDPAELALAASQQVFDRSPVAVLAAPTGDDDAVRAMQAAAAESLAAPALLVGETVSPQGAAAELERLGVQVAVVVTPDDPTPLDPASADPASPAPTGGAEPAETAADLAGASVVHLEAVEPLMPDEKPPTELPADDAARLRADVAAASAVPTHGPTPSSAALDEVLALTDPQPGQEAAIATLRAAGAVDVPVPHGRIASSARVIEAVDTAQALAVVGVGSSFGPPEEFAWRVAAAEAGTRLPTGAQDLLPARYVTTSADWWDEPADVVARAKDDAAAYVETSSDPVVPTLVVRVGQDADGDLEGERSAALEAMVTRALAADLYVLLDVPLGAAAPADAVEAWEGLLTLGGVGVTLSPEARPSDGTRPPGQVDAAEIEALVTYIEGVVTNSALPPALVAVHQTRPDSVVDRSRLADVADATEAAEVVLVADRTGADVTTGWVWDQVTDGAPDGVHLGWSGPTVPGTLAPELVPADPAPLLVAAS